jgi:hypothetical protein
VYQILEEGDECNILKCTLLSTKRRVQKFSIVLAILEEFLVNSLFLLDNKNPNNGYEGPSLH